MVVVGRRRWWKTRAAKAITAKVGGIVVAKVVSLIYSLGKM